MTTATAVRTAPAAPASRSRKKPTASVDLLSREAWNLSPTLAAPPMSVTERLHGTSLIPLPEMRIFVSYARACVQRGEMVGLDGPPGSGKTTCLNLLTAVSPVRTYYLSFPTTGTSKRMWQVIANAVVGPGATGTETDLQDQVVDTLALEPSLLILDEAINLRSEHVLGLRHLDNLRNKCGIVLAGAGLMAQAETNAALATRITRSLHLRDLGDEEVIDYARALHPAFAHTHADLLLQLNDTKLHGNRRRWHNLATLLSDLDANVLTEQAIPLLLTLLETPPKRGRT